jgi:hypothetical protein
MLRIGTYSTEVVEASVLLQLVEVSGVYEESSTGCGSRNA